MTNLIFYRKEGILTDNKEINIKVEESTVILPPDVYGITFYNSNVDGLQHIRILGFPQQLGISIKDIKEKNRENYYLYIKKNDMEILYSLWEKSGDLSFEIIEKKSTDNEKISDKI